MLLASACAGGPPEDTPSTPAGLGHAAGPAAPVPAPGSDEPAPPALRRPVVLGVRVVPVEAQQAEDGRGGMVAARDAVAIDVTAERWPVRALDPALHVGQLVLRHYRHVSPRVLRFVLADRSALPRGAPACVMYGDDEGSRVWIAASLEVAP